MASTILSPGISSTPPFTSHPSLAHPHAAHQHAGSSVAVGLAPQWNHLPHPWKATCR